MAVGAGEAEFHGAMPEPQIVLAKRPEGKLEERFARLDAAAGCLRLRAIVKGPDDKVDIGPEMSLGLSSLSAVRAEGTQVRLDGEGGEEFLRLFCETPENAKAWAHGMQEVARMHGSSGASPRAAGDAQAGSSEVPVAMLKELVQRQESRLAQLEGLNQRKEEQLLKLHSRLEEALVVLQAGQATYAEQQKVLEANQLQIKELQERAAQSEDREDEEEMYESQAEVVQRILAASRAAAGAGLGSVIGGGAADDDDEEDENEDMPLDANLDMGTEVNMQAPQVLAHLQSILAAKDQLEAQLQDEQAELEQQIRDMYAQMGREPPNLDFDDDDVDEDTSP